MCICMCVCVSARRLVMIVFILRLSPPLCSFFSLQQCLERCKKANNGKNAGFFGVKNGYECWCDPNDEYEQDADYFNPGFELCTNTKYNGVTACPDMPNVACGSGTRIIRYRWNGGFN